VCGPTYVANCGQFSSMSSCTCNPAASPQACQLAPQLQYFTYDPVTQQFMYCQWQFVPSAGGMQCTQGSSCLPNTNANYAVCQGGYQFSQSTNQQLTNQIAQMNAQILSLQANCTRLQFQVNQAQNENTNVRLELTENQIIRAQLQAAVASNITHERLYDNALNWSYTEALRNDTYWYRFTCPVGQSCCYSSALATAPFLGLLGLVFLV